MAKNGLGDGLKAAADMAQEKTKLGSKLKKRSWLTHGKSSRTAHTQRGGRREVVD